MSEPKSAAEMIADSYSDLVKNSIAIRIDGCKSMAIGCPTIAGIYAGLLAAVVFGNHHSMPQSQSALILIPICVFALAGLAFAFAVLPNRRLKQLLPSGGHVLTQDVQTQELLTREAHVYRWQWVGTIMFWVALASGLAILFLVHLPGQ